jgi:C4-dicarboxylate transporter DctM subunit
MLVVGTVGYIHLSSWPAFFAYMKTNSYYQFANYTLSVIPLFILMGALAERSGISTGLFRAAEALTGRMRGGLAMAVIWACTAFGAICGSSVATTATFGRAALPELQRYKYDGGFATGTIAAGGTLGILIPPSVIMIIYGSMTETSIGHLFIAGIVPGILAVLLYMAAVSATTILDPAAGPAGPRVAWVNRFRALREVWMVVLLFVMVIGGIYLGVFTPTEAAGIGAAGAFIAALLRRSLTFSGFVRILYDSARTSAALMAVLVGALIFSNYVNITGAPEAVVEALKSFNFPPLGVMVLILIFYLFLGCVFDALAMILLTVPIFFPLVMALGYDPVWFGIIVVVVVELGLITPPIGMNLFVIQSVARDIPMTTIYRGILPFIAVDIIRLAILVLFPWIVLFLPQQMG